MAHCSAKNSTLNSLLFRFSSIKFTTFSVNDSLADFSFSIDGSIVMLRPNCERSNRRLSIRFLARQMIKFRLNGLSMKSSTPFCRHVSFWASELRPVRIMNGICFKSSLLRTFCNNSRPFMPGMDKSLMIRSMGVLSKVFQASSPSEDRRVSKCGRRLSSRYSSKSASSSTRSTLGLLVATSRVEPGEATGFFSRMGTDCPDSFTSFRLKCFFSTGR